MLELDYPAAPGLPDFDDAVNDAVADLSATGARLLAEVERLKDALRRERALLNAGCIALESLDSMGERITEIHKGVNLREAIKLAIREEADDDRA